VTEARMLDLLMLALTIFFFGLAVAYVAAVASGWSKS
jgi:hypothetical protein